MASNKLMQLPAGSLDGLKSLRRLALFWNRVLRLPSFTDLVALEELQLNSNQLQVRVSGRGHGWAELMGTMKDGGWRGGGGGARRGRLVHAPRASGSGSPGGTQLWQLRFLRVPDAKLGAGRGLGQ